MSEKVIRIKHYMEKFFLGSLILLFLLTPHTLFSNSTKRIFDMSLEELMQFNIKSAGKQDEKISDIPANVTIITRDDIERMGYTTLEEILIHVPGLYHLDNYEDFLLQFMNSLLISPGSAASRKRQGFFHTSGGR